MTTQLHKLAALSNTKKKKRVGRGNGSGKGTYSTRGIKGQRARSGGRSGLVQRSLMRQLIKKLPNIGGFSTLVKKSTSLTLLTIKKSCNEGDTITLAYLKAKRLIPPSALRAKIIGTCVLTKKITIAEPIRVSKEAHRCITASGGICFPPKVA